MNEAVWHLQVARRCLAGGRHTLPGDYQRIDPNYVAIIGRSYTLKDSADYGGGLPLMFEQVRTALDEAERFVDAIETIVPPPTP